MGTSRNLVDSSYTRQATLHKLRKHPAMDIMASIKLLDFFMVMKTIITLSTGTALNHSYPKIQVV